MNEKELTRLLEQIASMDQTPEYSYFKGNAYLDANGDAPKPGSRFCTPREICKRYLTDIKNGTLEHSLKCLVGEIDE